MKIEPDIYDGTKFFFNLFRRELAEAAGIIPVNSYFGVPDDAIDWKYIATLTDFTGYWSIQPKDPIWYLLAHSDSSGCIKNEHLKLLSDRIKILQNDLPGKDKLPNWKKYASDFNKKVLKAHSEKQDLIFKQI